MDREVTTAKRSSTADNHLSILVRHWYVLIAFVPPFRKAVSLCSFSEELLKAAIQAELEAYGKQIRAERTLHCPGCQRSLRSPAAF